MVLSCAVSIPHHIIACQKILKGAPIKIPEDVGVHAKGRIMGLSLQQYVCVGQILSDLYTEEFGAANQQHLNIVDVDREMFVCTLFPKVHNPFLSLADIKREIIFLTPSGQ